MARAGRSEADLVAGSRPLPLNQGSCLGRAADYLRRDEEGPAECDEGRQCAKHERYSDLAVLAACGVEQRGEQHDQRQA